MRMKCRRNLWRKVRIKEARKDGPELPMHWRIDSKFNLRTSKWKDPFAGLSDTKRKRKIDLGRLFHSGPFPHSILIRNRGTLSIFPRTIPGYGRLNLMFDGRIDLRYHQTWFRLGRNRLNCWIRIMRWRHRIDPRLRIRGGRNRNLLISSLSDTLLRRISS